VKEKQKEKKREKIREKENLLIWQGGRKGKKQ
jgi:hypothetical protein